MAAPEIDEGTRAIIELTAERAAEKAIQKHQAACSIRHLWAEHKDVRERVEKLRIGWAWLIGMGVGSGAIGGGIGAWLGSFLGKVMR